MVNGDAPRPHKWEQPRPQDAWLICRVCSGYKAFVDLDHGTVGRLKDQIEKACGKWAVIDFFVEQVRIVRDLPSRRAPLASDRRPRVTPPMRRGPSSMAILRSRGGATGS